MSMAIKTLTWLGALPFVGLTLLLYVSIESIPGIGPTQFALTSYALMIVVFMAGTHWGQSLRTDPMRRQMLFVASNVLALGMWFAYVLAPDRIVLLIGAATLVVLFLIECLFATALDIDPEYLSLRAQVTGVASLSLMAALFVA